MTFEYRGCQATQRTGKLKVWLTLILLAQRKAEDLPDPTLDSTFLVLVQGSSEGHLENGLRSMRPGALLVDMNRV